MGSQIIVDAVDVQPGDVVVDYCAGNGGKTLALASQMWERRKTSSASFSASSNHTGVIIAHDVE